MNKLIAFLLMLTLSSNVLADTSPAPTMPPDPQFKIPVVDRAAKCNWTKIKPSTDGKSFIYPKDLHLCVGLMVEDTKAKDIQIDDLNKAINLKDLALQKSDERASKWMDTSFKLEDNMSKIKSEQKSNDVLFFALGALTIVGAGMGMYYITHH